MLGTQNETLYMTDFLKFKQIPKGKAIQTQLKSIKEKYNGTKISINKTKEENSGNKCGTLKRRKLRNRDNG